MANIKTPDQRKGGSFSIRFLPADEKKVMAACHRDMLKPSLWAEKILLDAADKLIEQQKIRGYQCMFPHESLPS